MGILDRINTLIRANVNDLIQRADVPERALDRSIDDMQSSVAEARAQLRRGEQDEAQLHQQWRRAREESLEWEDKAMRALRDGDEGAARELLIVKKKVDRRADALRDELEQRRAFLADLARSLDALEVKLDAVRGRRHAIGRHVGAPPPPTERPTLPFDQDAPSLRGRHALALDEDLRREMPEAAFGAERPFQEFDRIQDRVSRLEADAAAQGALDPLHDDLPDRFRGLERERDLRDLRARAQAPDAPAARLSDLRRKLAEELDG
jgi:phage shock protein A